MYRRIFLLASNIILIVLFFMPQITRSSENQNRATLNLLAGPYLQHVTQTSITSMWETDQPATSEVEYGQKVPPDQTNSDTHETNIHEITLKNLEPESPYLYRIRSNSAGGEISSDIYTFPTAALTESAFAFVIVGDTRTFPDRFEKIAQLAVLPRNHPYGHVPDDGL